MKAAVVEKPGSLAVREVPEPLPSEYDCLCKMLYGVTSTGAELLILSGRLPWPVRYPTIIGRDTVGRVIETGSKVRYLKKGDLVVRAATIPSVSFRTDVTWGGFVEYGIARDHRAMKEDGRKMDEWSDYRAQLVVPPEIHASQAVMIPSLSEAMSCLIRAGFSTGMSLLVIGSGGHALAFTLCASIIGGTRLAVVGSDARRALALKSGATDVFDYKTDRLTARVANVCPVGFDMIIDTIGSKGNLDKFLPLLKPRGTICIFGWEDYGSCVITPSRAKGPFTCVQAVSDNTIVHERVCQLMANGKLDTRAWLNADEPFPLQRISEAFEALKTRRLLKALIQLLPA